MKNHWLEGPIWKGSTSWISNDASRLFCGRSTTKHPDSGQVALRTRATLVVEAVQKPMARETNGKGGLTLYGVAALNNQHIIT